MQNPGLGDSDHTCINFVLNCYAKDDDRIKLPNYFKAKYKTIRERLSAVNWTSELDADFIIYRVHQLYKNTGIVNGGVYP